MQDVSQPKRIGGLSYAAAADGRLLPVIDLTHPRFHIADDPQSLAKHRDALLEWDLRTRWIPSVLIKLLLQRGSKRSALAKAMFRPDDSFLDSISTYVLKLGPDDLPAGYEDPWDKKLATSPHVPLLRLRMQQIATSLAQALVGRLQADARAPLRLINIAGGPALDSINVLILLGRDHPELLQRPIVIDVLDLRSDGAAFGANALRALMQSGAPLHGLAVDFRYHPYDWNAPATLTAVLDEGKASGAIVAASSEGGLFEYGSDDAIVANLKALAAGAVRFVAGSVTSASATRKRMLAQTTFTLVPRGLEGFAPLAAQAGYAVAASQPTVFSDQVLLGLR